MSGSVDRGPLPQNDKKAHLCRMETLGVFALIFWEVIIDVYRYISTEGIVWMMPSSGGRLLFTQK
jgi:hypothetical protein